MSKSPPEIPHLHNHSAVLSYLRDAARAGLLPPGAVIFLFAGEGAGPPLAEIVDDVPPNPPQHERVRLTAALLTSAASSGCAEFALVVCRSGSALVTGDDLAWHDAAYGVRRPDAPSCEGVYVVARGRVIRVVPSSAQHEEDAVWQPPAAEAG